MSYHLLVLFCTLLYATNLMITPLYSQASQKQTLSHPEKTERQKDQLNTIRDRWLQEIHTDSNNANPKTADDTKTSTGSIQTVPTPQAPSPRKEKLDKQTPLATPSKEQESKAAARPDTIHNFGETSETEGPSFVSAFVRFFLLIGLLLFIFYVGFRFFRFRHKGLFRRGDELVQIIASVPLVQGKFLQIVDVAGQLMALSVSETGIQFLANINDGLTADRIRLWQSQQNSHKEESIPTKPTFIEKLFAVLQGRRQLSFSMKPEMKNSFAVNLGQLIDSPKNADQDTTANLKLKQLLHQQKERLLQTPDES